MKYRIIEYLDGSFKAQINQNTDWILMNKLTYQNIDDAKKAIENYKQKNEIKRIIGA